MHCLYLKPKYETRASIFVFAGKAKAGRTQNIQCRQGHIKGRKAKLGSCQLQSSLNISICKCKQLWYAFKGKSTSQLSTANRLNLFTLTIFMSCIYKCKNFSDLDKWNFSKNLLSETWDEIKPNNRVENLQHPNYQPASLWVYPEIFLLNLSACTYGCMSLLKTSLNIFSP